MKYIAFLRGMNLGGRRITNADLCGCFDELGFEGAWAFLASGNVVIEHPSTSRAQVTRLIEDGLARSLGYQVPTFVRSAREVTDIAAASPFATSHGAEGGKLQVSLLARKPSAAQRSEALSFATPQDQLAIDGTEFYWLPDLKITESKLDLKGIESALGVMTMRTHRTLMRLAEKL